MKKITYEKVFKIDPEAAPKGLRNPLARHLVEKAAGFRKLDRIISDARSRMASGEDVDFNDAVLAGMDIELQVSDEDIARIPKTGPVIVVSNHPFGGIEGVALLKILSAARPDHKVMANGLLSIIPEMRKDFIFVNPFGSASAKKENIRPLLECMRFLKEGHLLGVFPAGEVSSVDLKTRMVRDPAWSPTIASLARKSGATVVPMFFAGRNPAFFQLAGLVHPRLRTALLPRMFEKRRNQPLTAYLGAPILPSEIAKIQDDAELVKYFRLRAYALEGRVAKPHKTLFPKRKPKTPGPLEEIIPETPVADIEAAIAALPKDAFLLSGSGLDVYFTKLAPESPIMRELGRLREVTFRTVGEGTGRSTDVDVFDPNYHHLFLWDPKARCIVGAYRLGLAPEIVAAFGVQGLYTHTLFKYSKKLMDKCQPAIELGRSWVRPEYQKAFAPLLMLWKGIGTFISRHPEYANLFGPVSITAAYRDASRNMLLRSLRLTNFAGELARFVKPRNPPKRPRKAEWKANDYREFIANTDEVSAMIQDIEKDHKSIPVLIKQYIKLGGRILAFNVDPDFSDVVDGLILVDLRKTDPRTRAHYMGPEADRIFREYHKLG